MVYLQCLEWSEDQISEVLGNGGFVDAGNSDKTLSRIHNALGQKFGLSQAMDPVGVLIKHKALEEIKE